MLINLKVKTLDAQTHEFSIDNEITVREFKDKVAEKTNISAEQQRIIYCGRVLVDEKQLKEYDVNGKVVHVAERPPPSSRGSSSASAADNPPRRNTRGMRSSPLFRALDGMVVGTMAIPMNPGANNAQMQLNPFTTSSSFCMNRITVARHMLECANNIAAFLEDPSRGLNNSSLDILAQGRWTMESTVVEVGITAADIPQEQNIVDMLEGAVSAALRRNGNTNVTVVQLPTVFGSSENPDGTRTSTETTAVVVEEPMDDALEDSVDSAVLHTSTSTEEMETTNEDEAPQLDGAAPVSPVSTVLSGTAATAGTSSSTNSLGSATSGGAGSCDATNDDANSCDASSGGATTSATSSSTASSTVEPNNSTRRRTGTGVLADVIDQMRAVQTRLNPFVERFYDMLRNEPTFEENDTAGRENAQRLYDRVSEAFHYMSHAQHAISDLLLDVSQPAPRYLACRPILVEQSGYVSSNNYLSTAAATAAAGLGHLAGSARQQPQQQQQSQQGRAQTQAPQAPRRPETESPATNPVTTAADAAASSNAPVDDPVDEPIAPPTVINAPAVAAPNAANGRNTSNHQMQVARLIQAVVNSAPIDAEFHVQINAPNVVSFGAPINASSSATRTSTAPQQQNNAQVAAERSDNHSQTEAVNGSEDIPPAQSPTQARATTATLPTTATQTRSTSRPHVQIGSLPAGGGWNGRVIPANMMSSFDRFLPCSSHHVREPEHVNANNSSGANTGTSAQNGARVNQRTLRNITDLFHRSGPPFVSAPLLGVRANAAIAAAARSTAASSARSTLAARTPEPQLPAVVPAVRIDSETRRRLCLRVQLLNFIKDRMFAGAPINEDTITEAVNKAIRWLHDVLFFLPQYDLPRYNSRDSIEKLLRHSLPGIIDLVNRSQDNVQDFEQRLSDLITRLMKRLFSILAVCAGRVNAEIYWCELMRTLLAKLRSNFRGESLQFLQIYVSTKVPTATDTNDAQQFLVHRNIESELSDTDTDVEMTEVASTSQNNKFSLDVDDPESMQQDDVVVGSEEWHSSFPADWIPIISRDIQRQREQPSEAPFSDAYIAGMSTKRRKIIQNSKPPTDIKSLVRDSVQQAIRATGVSTSTASNQSLTPDEITAAIAADSSVQASYCETLRSKIGERLKTDAAYKPDRFANTSKFFNK